MVAAMTPAISGLPLSKKLYRWTIVAIAKGLVSTVTPSLLEFISRCVYSNTTHFTDHVESTQTFIALARLFVSDPIHVHTNDPFDRFFNHYLDVKSRTFPDIYHILTFTFFDLHQRKIIPAQLTDNAEELVVNVIALTLATFPIKLINCMCTEFDINMLVMGTANEKAKENTNTYRAIAMRLLLEREEHDEEEDEEEDWSSDVDEEEADPASEVEDDEENNEEDVEEDEKLIACQHKYDTEQCRLNIISSLIRFGFPGSPI